MTKRIGFIGTGDMGEAMAHHLQAAGHTLTVYNRTKEKALSLIADGAHWADSPKACAAGQDVVITMVGFPKDVEEVYLGAEGIFSGAKAGAYLIDMTTTSPSLAQRLAKEGAQRGMRVLDAPVSGGDTGAKNATLSIMVGGRDEDFAAVKDIFDCMGTSVLLVGGPGAGQHVKMANQIAIAGAVSGVAEAIAYGQTMGLDVKLMLAAISGGAAGSWQMSHNGPKMVSGDNAPGFYIKHFLKDMKIALAEGKAQGLDLPVLRQVYDEYDALQQEGMGDLGTQALIQAYLKPEDQ